MEFEEAKNKFIQNWGALGSSWGINKTMAQIHALLLITPGVLSTEEIMAELKISRGNANMNIRALIDWGIVNKEYKAGERRDYFSADKDVWEIARKITKERSKREVEPVLKVLNEIKTVDGKGEEIETFKNVITDLESFTGKLNGVVDKFVKSDEHWFYKNLLKIVK
ncbi:GbsR/MarR family transcriptional regulator [Urechidicola croceus]|uniref:HTH-type transcriptional regulator n=1 Tax=Urechidicola croceus TaxID=1850246 RepID=A0A1D8P7J6_9FLAO|nr:transcriptional regulator [Urechidicola croceus]AOW20544.1 transcriptional regulator [Urechidicola croceus]